MNTNNSTVEAKNNVSKKGTLIKILIVAFFIAGGLFFAYRLGVSSTQNPQATNISDVFADVNNDGKPDLIVSAQVILNTDQNASFLASQVQK